MRSLYLLAALAPTVFGQSACDSQLDGSYSIALAGNTIGTGTIEGTAMTMTFGALGEASGTFTHSDGEGTATLTGSGTIGSTATGTNTGPYSWNSDCSEATIAVAGQSVILARTGVSTGSPSAGIGALVAEAIKEYKTMVQMTLTGDVSDHEAKLAHYKESFATRFGVSVENVLITLAAGSTVMTVTITSNEDISATVSSTLSDPAAADTLLGCTDCNEKAPTVTAVDDSNGGLSGGDIAAIVVGVVCALVIVLLVCYIMHKKEVPEMAIKDAQMTVSNAA